MSFHTPAHKQHKCDCPQQASGDGFHRSDCSSLMNKDQTLGDYIERKTPEKKLTFDEWWALKSKYPRYAHVEMDVAEAIWNDAQENK